MVTGKPSGKWTLLVEYRFSPVLSEPLAKLKKEKKKERKIRRKKERKKDKKKK